MRKLKFRAWSLTRKCWQPRYEFHINSDGCGTAEYPDGDSNLDDLVVEQYTGLKDKNGKEIYEGDIVKCYSRRKLIGEYQVIWNEDCGGFECESLKPLVDGGGRTLKDVRVFNEISIQFRVIGNIHENPELVEGEA